MSMPDETPAAVTTLPCSTTRSATGLGAVARELVAHEPVRRRLAGRRAGRPRRARSEPVQTDVVHVDVLVRARGPSRATSSSSSSAPGAEAAGHERRRRAAAPRRASARRRASASPVSVRTGPGSAATNVTSRAGQAREHLVGADGVERGEAVEEEDGDVHGGSPRVGLRRRGGAEAVAVGGGADAEAAVEGAAHRLGACRSRRPAATASTAASVVLERRRARSTRTASTYAAGVVPASSRKARAKLRGLM